MGTLIDSSALIAAERGGVDLGTLLAPFERERVAVAAITAAELLHGVLRASSELRRSRRERFVEEVLTSVPVLAFDLEAALHPALGRSPGCRSADRCARLDDRCHGP